MLKRGSGTASHCKRESSRQVPFSFQQLSTTPVNSYCTLTFITTRHNLLPLPSTLAATYEKMKPSFSLYLLPFEASTLKVGTKMTVTETLPISSSDGVFLPCEMHFCNLLRLKKLALAQSVCQTPKWIELYDHPLQLITLPLQHTTYYLYIIHGHLFFPPNSTPLVIPLPLHRSQCLPLSNARYHSLALANIMTQ